MTHSLLADNYFVLGQLSWQIKFCPSWQIKFRHYTRNIGKYLWSSWTRQTKQIKLAWPKECINQNSKSKPFFQLQNMWSKLTTWAAHHLKHFSMCPPTEVMCKTIRLLVPWPWTPRQFAGIFAICKRQIHGNDHGTNTIWQATVLT